MKRLFQIIWISSVPKTPFLAFSEMITLCQVVLPFLILKCLLLEFWTNHMSGRKELSKKGRLKMPFSALQIWSHQILLLSKNNHLLKIWNNLTRRDKRKKRNGLKKKVNLLKRKNLEISRTKMFRVLMPHNRKPVIVNLNTRCRKRNYKINKISLW